MFELKNQWVVVVNTIHNNNTSSSIRLSCYIDKDTNAFHRCYKISSSILSYDILEIDTDSNEIAKILIVLVLKNGDILYSIITLNRVNTTITNNDNIEVSFRSIDEMLGIGEYYKDTNITGEFHNLLSMNETINSCIAKVTNTNVLIVTNTKSIVISTEAILHKRSDINLKEVYNRSNVTSTPTAVLFLNGLSHLEKQTDEWKLEAIARRRSLLDGWKSLIRSSEAYEPDGNIESNACDYFIVGFSDGTLLYITTTTAMEVAVYSWEIPLASSTTLCMPIDDILLANLSNETYQEASSLTGLLVSCCNLSLATHLVILSGSRVIMIGSRIVCKSIMPDFQSFDISILQNVQSSSSPTRYSVKKAIFVDMSMFFLYDGALYTFTINNSASKNNVNNSPDITRLTDPTSPAISNIKINNKGVLTLVINSNNNANDMDILQLNLGPEFDSKSYRHLFHYNSGNAKSSVDLTSNIRDTLSKINEYVREEVRKRTLISALDLESLRLINLLKILEQKQSIAIKSNSNMLDNWSLFANITVRLRNELGSTTTKGKRLYLDIDFVALDETTMKALHGRMISVTLAPVDRPQLTQEAIPSYSLPLNFATVGTNYTSKFAIPVTSTLSLAPISIDISLNVSLINVEIDYLYTNNVANSDKHFNTNSIGIASESPYQCACVFPLFHKEIPLNEMLMIISSDSFMEDKSLGAALVRGNRAELNRFASDGVQTKLVDDENFTMNIHVPKCNNANINTEALANTLSTFERSINTNNNKFDVAATIKPAFLKNIISHNSAEKNTDLTLNVKLGQAVTISADDDKDNSNMDVYHIRCNDISLASQIHAAAIDTLLESLPNDAVTEELVYSDGDLHSLPSDLRQNCIDLAILNTSLSNNRYNIDTSSALTFNIIDNILSNIKDDDGGYNEIKTKTKQLLHIYLKLRTTI